MKIARRKLILINFAFLGSAALGSTGFAARAGAENSRVSTPLGIT